MPRYKLAIFDLDGTLSDSLPWFRLVVNSIADKHRFRRIEDGDVEMLRGKSSREIIAWLGVPFWRMPLIAARHPPAEEPEHRSHSAVRRCRCDASAVVAAGRCLAMVSSDSESNVRRALRDHAALISQFACGASMFGKAAKFRAVLKRTGIAAARRHRHRR